MAKSKSFFGLRRGSTKSHTYQIYRGQQITKDRVYDVKNPQSQAQMEQRLKLPMVANYVAQLKGILNHSFEGVEYGEESLKTARQLNLRANQLSTVSYVPKGMMNAGVADFIVSKGTLPSVGTNGTYTDGNTTKVMAFMAANTNAVTLKDIHFNSSETDITSSALQALKPIFFGTEDFDQLTIIIAYAGNDFQWKGSDGEDKLEPYNRYVISRLVFDTDRFSENKGWKIAGNNTTGQGSWSIRNGYIKITFKDYDNPDTWDGELKNKDVINVTLDTTNTMYDGQTELMGAIIVSNLENDTWKRSNEAFIALNAEDISYTDVINTYIDSTNAVASTKYLNNGADSVDIAGGDTTA